jgi:predicted transcriptional regulator
VAAQGPSVGKNELDVLKVLWEEGPGTVRDVNARLRRQGHRLAYTTVLTMLQRLEAKELVASDKGNLAHVFRAAVSRDKLLRQRLKDLANQLCEGGTAPLVLALVEGHRYTVEEINRFRDLLDRLEGKKPKGKGSGGEPTPGT